MIILEKICAEPRLDISDAVQETIRIDQEQRRKFVRRV